LRHAALISVLFAILPSVDMACAQVGGDAPVQPACPPDVKGDPPTIGRGDSSEPLSDKLARSKGIICPPAGIDPEIQVKPPEGGTLKVIPPPGSPGGDPRVQPK
jgi:hypothetical protein